MDCVVIGAPVEEGSGRAGCAGGPGALRAAGVVAALRAAGQRVMDWGDLAPPAPAALPPHPNSALKALPEVAAWTTALSAAAYDAAGVGVPVFLGGDHSISAGTASGLARRWAERGRPLFLLWLDAHADFHTLGTTRSGNLHGVPLAYLTGQPGFAGFFPPLPARIKPARVCLAGIRSLDPEEPEALRGAGVAVRDMRAVAARGLVPLLRHFLRDVAAAGGVLHVSLDADFLDPATAPAVGTPVPGGVQPQEAREAMELLHGSGLVRGLDLVELNPRLDSQSRTATLMTDLAAALAGSGLTAMPARSL